eukprot:141399_1
MFSTRKSAKQVIRENKRTINRSIREIDRVLNRNKREKVPRIHMHLHVINTQEKIENEIKRLAKQVQTQAVRQLCRDLDRINQTEQQMNKFKTTLIKLKTKLACNQVIE